MPQTFLLCVGLIFPALSLLTYIASAVTRWKSGRYASPVFIPFVGPIVLTSWVIDDGLSNWIIPVVWLLDLGTIAFLVVLPRLIREWWRISIFTRTMTLRGADGIQRAILTLHRGGCYFLEKSWTRSQGELGIVGLGETGRFVDEGEFLTLESDFGLKRKVRRLAADSFVIEEPDGCRSEYQNYSLDGWRLQS